MANLLTWMELAFNLVASAKLGTNEFHRRRHVASEEEGIAWPVPPSPAIKTIVGDRPQGRRSRG